MLILLAAVLGTLLSIWLLLVILIICYRASEEQLQQQELQQQQQGVLASDASSGYRTMHRDAAAMQTDHPHRSGRHPTSSIIINSLPVIKYHPLGTGSTQVCAVCYEDFHADEDIKLLPCRHSYHGACIDAWLNRSNTCPMCNRDVTTGTAGLPTVTAAEALETPAAPPSSPSASVPPGSSSIANTMRNASFGGGLPALQQQQLLVLEVVVVPSVESRGHASQTAACPAEQQHCLECQDQ